VPQKTTRRADGVIVTIPEGRISASDVHDWTLDYARLLGGSYWIFLAAGATSYAYDAVKAAVEGFSKQKKRGLTLIIAHVPNPLVRMGASVVKMSLRQIAGVEIEIVDKEEQIEPTLERARRMR